MPEEDYFLWSAAQSIVGAELVHPGLPGRLSSLLLPGVWKGRGEVLELLNEVLDFCAGWFIFSSHSGLVAQYCLLCLYICLFAMSLWYSVLMMRCWTRASGRFCGGLAGRTNKNTL